jgi:hypothetical protein
MVALVYQKPFSSEDASIMFQCSLQKLHSNMMENTTKERATTIMPLIAEEYIELKIG